MLTTGGPVTELRPETLAVVRCDSRVEGGRLRTGGARKIVDHLHHVHLPLPPVGK